MDTKFTPEFIEEQRKLAAKDVSLGTHSWEFMAAGLKMLIDSAKYTASAANNFPSALDEIERLSARIKELEAAAQWCNIADKWPDEAADVVICIDGNVYPAWWQSMSEGDYESGYNNYRQWFYCVDGDKYEPLDPDCGKSFLWKPFPEPPDLPAGENRH